MLNYGSSITSAFPNTFCSSPSALVCQLCNTNINETGCYQSFGSSSNSTLFNQPYANMSKLEKCTHCGINICNKCINENQEAHHNNSANSNDLIDDNGYSIHNYSNQSRSSNQSQALGHYNLVKKEFKQMYNFSKEIVEKLHLLNNVIKIEESAIGELNLIKHQVNTKALELIKQINQEKNELIEQIDNVKQKYES